MSRNYTNGCAEGAAIGGLAGLGLSLGFFQVISWIAKSLRGNLFASKAVTICSGFIFIATIIALNLDNNFAYNNVLLSLVGIWIMPFVFLASLVCYLEARQNHQKTKTEQQAAQAEPKQTGEDSIRALLGARIKEMEAILERLQAERERLANVASDEELDALATEIRARQKLIHAINQGADDMELHLCVERIRAWEEERKEFEQMRLSDA